MADQKFAIQKQIFEINAFSKEQVHELQNKISRLVNFSLIKKMENYFWEVIPADLLFRMDQLVLDIGEVSWNSMEEDIEQRFMEALEYEFSQRLEFLKSDKNRSLAGISIETTEKAKLELFEYFLLYGMLPWYADTAVRFNMDELLDQLYSADRSAVRSIIQKAGKNAHVRFRMSHQFSDRSVKQFINIIEPAEAAYIFQTQEELMRVQHEEQIVQEPEEDFRKTVWLFIFNYLLAEMGSKFEKKMFIKSNLSQIAAHYNISYLNLLQSFYEVISTLKKTEVFQPLKTVIYELFTDETDTVSKDKLIAETTTASEPGILSLSSGMELLQYYLYTGSLPQAYEKMTRDDIKQLLFSMVKLAPTTMRKLLLSLNRHPKGILNFYQVIDAAGSETFAKLVYKEDIHEVENIITVFIKLQQIKPFSSAAGEDLKQEAWKYLLDRLLVKGVVDDETALTGYLVKRFALAMNFTESSLLVVLKDSIEKLAAAGSETDRPVALVKEILFAMDGANAADDIEDAPDLYHDETKEEEDILTTNYTTDQLSALVGYILQYGAMPWWAQANYRFSLEELITRLYEKDAAAMMLLFRKAIAIPAMKARLVLEIPPIIFKNLMEQLPGGVEVILHVDELLAMLEGSKLLQYYAPAFIQRTVFSIAWDIHSSSGYALFPGSLFYYETIKRFAALLKVEPVLFVSKLIQSPVTDNTQSLLQALLDHFEEEQKVEQRKAFTDDDTADNVAGKKQVSEQQQTDILPLIAESKTIQRYFEFTERPDSAVVTELAAVLQYFLQWNRLPDNFSVLEKDEQKKLLREILTILFSGSSVALRSLIEDRSNARPARGYLNELFSVAEGGQQKRMAEFLFEISLPAGDMLMEQTTADNYFIEQENVDVDLVKIFSKDAELTDTITSDKVLEESKRVLAYFLMYNRLPDDIEVTGKGSIEKLLRDIILFLFAQDKMFISEQFQHAGTSVAAKFYLYDILAVSYDIRTGQVNNFMQQLRYADLDNELKEVLKDEREFFEKDPSAFISKMLQTQNQDDRFLLSSSSFAKMILDRYGTEMLLKLASLKISWPFASASVIQGWLEFLQKAIPPGLYKDKVLELFNRFNILFISGRLNIYSNDSYTIALVNYLSGQLGIDAGAIFRQLFDHTLQPAKDTATSVTDQYHLMQRMFRPVIARQEELRRADAAIKAAEEKRLSLAVKEEIARHRQALAESLKKEMQQNKEETVADENDTNDKLKPETGESIYIANAGLVLFHPFLETYFSRTGLMENHIFIDENSRNRAVLLLQYLATGGTEHAEHEMVLNKILCNVPLEEAIPVSFTATETEIEVTLELLEVVIERWDKMKNTSHEGFQHSFIMRDGMLNFREDYWNLKVEQRGYDILLQTLPWAFGYVKMSWMQHNLIVEWI